MPSPLDMGGAQQLSRRPSKYLEYGIGQEKKFHYMTCEFGVSLMVIVREGVRLFQLFDALLMMMVSTYIFWLFCKDFSILHT
jgi:hypothetical protein